MNISELSECYSMLQPRKIETSSRMTTFSKKALQKNNISESFSEKRSQEPPSEEAIPQEEPKKAPEGFLGGTGKGLGL